jgi:hypothetical protein
MIRAIKYATLKLQSSFTNVVGVPYSGKKLGVLQVCAATPSAILLHNLGSIPTETASFLEKISPPIRIAIAINLMVHRHYRHS